MKMADQDRENMEIRVTPPSDVYRWISMEAKIRGVSKQEITRRKLISAYEEYRESVKS
jgi:hypothetical protein